MTVEIPLGHGLVAVVDDMDGGAVLALTWHAKRRPTNTYARRSVRKNGRVRTVYLHAFVTGWAYVDHINGDGLDNRRANLREASHAQNMRNVPALGGKSRFKGVTWDPSSSGWMARIARDGTRHYLGVHSTEEAAAAAYDTAARELHGPFATFNFPKPGERRAYDNDFEDIQIGGAA